jgi:hypothetical protein
VYDNGLSNLKPPQVVQSNSDKLGFYFCALRLDENTSHLYLFVRGCASGASAGESIRLRGSRARRPVWGICSHTAMASEIIFGLFWLLGYEFSPRLADISGARFWRTTAQYGSLEWGTGTPAEGGRFSEDRVAIANRKNDELSISEKARLGARVPCKEFLFSDATPRSARLASYQMVGRSRRAKLEFHQNCDRYSQGKLHTCASRVAREDFLGHPSDEVKCLAPA